MHDVEVYPLYYQLVPGRLGRPVALSDAVSAIIIHSKYFPVSDWLKPHA